MSFLLRHPGAVPALFSRESEARPARPGLGAFWRGTARPNQAAPSRLAGGGRAAGWYAAPLVLLFAEVPMMKAATTLLSLALPH